MFDNFLILITRELKLSAAKWSYLCHNISFLLIATALFAFVFASDAVLLHKIGGQIILIIMLLGLNFSSLKLFEEDFSDGTMDQLIIAEIIPSTVFLSKVVANWILNIVPLIILLPIFAVMFGYDADIAFGLLMVFLTISPLLVIICGLASLLTIGSGPAAYLTFIIALPLNFSFILLASIAVEHAVGKAGWYLLISNLAVIYGLLFVLAPIVIFCAGKVLKEKL